MSEKPSLWDAKLCFVKNNLAHFTHHDLKEVTGDDWDDRPYEHNGGWPYSEYVAVRIAFWTDSLYEPCEGHTNSPYTVEAINGGAVAWLAHYRGGKSIPAGATLREFVATIDSVAGQVFLPWDEGRYVVPAEEYDV